MREEYDFSQGERGKFYSADAQYQLPVYLDPEVMDYFSAKAKAKGVELNQLVNDLLRQDISIIEGVSQ
jgi:predicted HicB family RNase H-like nuclease